MRLNTGILHGSMMNLSNHNGACMLSIIILKLQGNSTKKKWVTIWTFNFGWKKCVSKTLSFVANIQHYNNYISWFACTGSHSRRSCRGLTLSSSLDEHKASLKDNVYWKTSDVHFPGFFHDDKAEYKFYLVLVQAHCIKFSLIVFQKTI